MLVYRHILPLTSYLYHLITAFAAQLSHCFEPYAVRQDSYFFFWKVTVLLDPEHFFHSTEFRSQFFKNTHTSKQNDKQFSLRLPSHVRKNGIYKEGIL